MCTYNIVQVKKKIALVSNTSWSVYNFRLGLIRRLKELGYDVSIIAPQDNFSAKLVAEGFNFYHIYTNNYGTNPLSDLKTLLQLRRIYSQNKFDFIFHYTIKPNIYGTLAARWCKIPSIAITTGLGRLFSFNNWIVKFLSIKLYQIAANYSQQVWFLNQSDLQSFIEKKIIGKEKVFLLPSEGINTQRFKKSESYYKNSNRKLVFLFAGRIIWDKGVKEFVEAAKIIKEKFSNVEFQILGFIDPSNPNAVPYGQIQEWQKQEIISYLGETEDVRPYIDNCSCLVFPSFYNEGISRILLEAAAMSKPIITTDNVGCRDVVQDNVNGFICKIKDKDDLALKISQFIQLTPNEQDLMGLNGRKIILKKFSEDQILKIYTNYLNQYFNQTLNHDKKSVLFNNE